MSKKIKSVDQLTVAKLVATRLGLNLAQVMAVIEYEQKTTMSYVRKGYKVVKKNYLTLTPFKRKAYKIKSPLDGKYYSLPEQLVVKVKLGSGFKNYVAEKNNKMPEKICRYVKKDNAESEQIEQQIIKEATQA
jgi:nucleoid DNA-binding protein